METGKPQNGSRASLPSTCMHKQQQENEGERERERKKWTDKQRQLQRLAAAEVVMWLIMEEFQMYFPPTLSSFGG